MWFVWATCNELFQPGDLKSSAVHNSITVGTVMLLLFFYFSIFISISPSHSEMVMVLSWYIPNTHFHHLFYYHFYQFLLLKLIHLGKLLECHLDQWVSELLLFHREHIQLKRGHIQVWTSTQRNLYRTIEGETQSYTLRYAT